MDAGFYTLLVMITDLGDSAVLSALVVALCAYLLAQHCRREALILAGAFAAACVSIAAVKVLLMGCGTMLRHYGLHSPSGHSALSVTVYGLMAFLLGNRLPQRFRFIPMGLLIPLAIMIALSRVILGCHTLAEVIAGVLIGLVVLVGAEKLLAREPARRFNPFIFLFLMVAVAVAFHGLRLPAESIIQLIAHRFSVYARCAEG